MSPQQKTWLWQGPQSTGKFLHLVLTFLATSSRKDKKTKF